MSGYPTTVTLNIHVYDEPIVLRDFTDKGFVSLDLSSSVSVFLHTVDQADRLIEAATEARAMLAKVAT